MATLQSINPGLVRALNTAKDVVARLTAAGYGVRGLVGSDSAHRPILAIDPPRDPAALAARSLGAFETPVAHVALFGADYHGAFLTWSVVTAKPAHVPHQPRRLH